jgi:hypothetical protein
VSSKAAYGNTNPMTPQAPLRSPQRGLSDFGPGGAATPKDAPPAFLRAPGAYWSPGTAQRDLRSAASGLPQSRLLRRPQEALGCVFAAGSVQARGTGLDAPAGSAAAPGPVIGQLIRPVNGLTPHLPLSISRRPGRVAPEDRSKSP